MSAAVKLREEVSADELRTMARESRDSRQCRCVWMKTKFAEWASGHRQPMKIELYGNLRRKTFPTPAQFW